MKNKEVVLEAEEAFHEMNNIIISCYNAKAELNVSKMANYLNISENFIKTVQNYLYKLANGEINVSKETFLPYADGNFVESEFAKVYLKYSENLLRNYITFIYGNN